MARYSIGWSSIYNEVNDKTAPASTEWVQVEASNQYSRIISVVDNSDAEIMNWAQDWISEIERHGEIPSPWSLAVRYGSGATLHKVMTDGTLRPTRPRRKRRGTVGDDEPHLIDEADN